MPAGLLIIGAIFGFLGVALGAFGAHSLRSVLSQEMVDVFETGVRYHMYHVVGVLAAGWGFAMIPHARFRQAGYAFLLGIVLFSGSLYALSVSEMRWLGVVTPIGGVLFLAGWGLLAHGFWCVHKPIDDA